MAAIGPQGHAKVAELLFGDGHFACDIDLDPEIAAERAAQTVSERFFRPAHSARQSPHPAEQSCRRALDEQEPVIFVTNDGGNGAYARQRGFQFFYRTLLTRAPFVGKAETLHRADVTYWTVRLTNCPSKVHQRLIVITWPLGGKK